MFQVQEFPVVRWRPECVICEEPVKLEESKTDENGQAIHEECYVSSLTSRKLKVPVTRVGDRPDWGLWRRLLCMVG